MSCDFRLAEFLITYGSFMVINGVFGKPGGTAPLKKN